MKRNKSYNVTRVPYLVYKRCPRLSKVVFNILDQLWERKEVPLHWRIGEAILIGKTEDLSDPSKFRNIKQTLVESYRWDYQLIGCWITWSRTAIYLDSSIQKGFLRKTPGCLELTQTLTEELKDAKSTRRQIYVAWIDLMNAYGRVSCMP